ncbi:MAG: pilus assembly protein PilP [Thermodesulfovibrionia bacterium]
MAGLKRALIIILLTIVVAIPVSGCKKAAPPEKKPEVKKEEVKPDVSAETTTSQVKGYTYEPAGRRDPFAPLVELKKTKKTAKGERPPGTLESYDVGDFALIAIVKKGDKFYALLRSPDNKSFTVNEGDIIGLHNGKIEKITDNRVVVVEYIEDYKGNKKPKEVVLELHKEG